MNWVFLETSALLEYVASQPRETEIRHHLDAAPGLVASELALFETARVLARMGSPARAAQERLRRVAAVTMFHPMQADLIERMRQAFPVEPVRTLDAIHLATALALRLPGEEVGFLALDDRVRQNAVALGFQVLP